MIFPMISHVKLPVRFPMKCPMIFPMILPMIFPKFTRRPDIKKLAWALARASSLRGWRVASGRDILKNKTHFV